MFLFLFFSSAVVDCALCSMAQQRPLFANHIPEPKRQSSRAPDACRTYTIPNQGNILQESSPHRRTIIGRHSITALFAPWHNSTPCSQITSLNLNDNRQEILTPIEPYIRPNQDNILQESCRHQVDYHWQIQYIPMTIN